MASRPYNTYKFIYTDDLGNRSLKRQRIEIDDSDLEIIPRTPLFNARVVDSQFKVTGTSQGLRHLLSYINGGKFITKLPYSSDELPQLEAHIKEILAVPRVECGDYRGEDLITGGIATNL